MLTNPIKQGLSDKENGHQSRYALYQNWCPIMVEVTGLEPAASCSQSRRATTCATPRYFYINFFLVSLFSSLLCPLPCGSRNLFGSIVSLDIPTAAPKNARFFCHRQRSRFLPKAGVLPPALHLDIFISTFFLYLCFLPCFVRPLAVPVISSAQ